MLVLPLNDGHDRKRFDCGNAELNSWFAQVARQHKEKGVSSTFVAVADASASEVLGFYAISLAELLHTELPAQYRKRLPSKVPVFRLGEYMLFDAIDRVTRISGEVGGIGLVVNAKPAAVEFYKRYGFEGLADHPLNLFLSL
jgi:hypothetical protein